MQRCHLPLRAFVDPEFLGWMRLGLPLSLMSALGEHPDIPWDTPVSELFGPGIDQFETRLTDAIMSTHDERNAYHGMPHAQRVVDNGDDALNVLHIILGRLPGELAQAVLFALALHDKGHPGATFFAFALHGRVPADLDDPTMTPVEWYTATILDRMMARVGFSVLARLVGTYVVFASTYGAAAPQGKLMGIDAVKPRSIFGCLMRACDVTPPAEHSIAINDETSILYLEVPADPVPIAWHEYLNGRQQFLGYVRLTHRLLDEAVALHLPGERSKRFSFTHDLGWARNLHRCEQVLGRIINHQAPAKTAVLRARLGILGVALD